MQGSSFLKNSAASLTEGLSEVGIGEPFVKMTAYHASPKRHTVVAVHPERENMKRFALLAVVGTLVSACGGGGGGDNPTTPQAPTNKLAAYVGNWSADCSDHQIDNVAISSPTANTLTINVRTDYYAAANCTGAIVATETETADVTATYVDTVDSSIVFTPNATATPAKVDRVTASSPQHSRSITGTAVSHVVVNGQAQWCIDYGTSKTCIMDEGAFAAQSGVSGGLFLQNNILYELAPNGSQYVVDERFNKK